MKTMYVCNVTDEVLAKMIRGAQRKVTLFAPGVSLEVARVLIEKERWFSTRSEEDLFGSVVPDYVFRVALDVSLNIVKLGYGEARALLALWVADREHASRPDLCWFWNAPRMRLGLLTADDRTLIFTPVPRLMETCYETDLRGRSPNGVLLDAEPRFAQAYLDSLCPMAERPVNMEDIRNLVDSSVVTLSDLERLLADRQAQLRDKDRKVAELEEIVRDCSVRLAGHNALTMEEALRLCRQCVTVCAAHLSFRKTQVGRLTLQIPSEFLLDESLAARCSSGYEVLLPSDIDELNALEAVCPVLDEADGSAERYTFSRLKEELAALREAYLWSIGNHRSVMRCDQVDELEATLDRYRAIAATLHRTVLEAVKERIGRNLNALFDDICDRMPPCSVKSYVGIKHDFLNDVFCRGQRTMGYDRTGKYYYFLSTLSSKNRTKLDLSPPEVIFETMDYPRHRLLDPAFQQLIAERLVIKRHALAFGAGRTVSEQYPEEVRQARAEFFDAINAFAENAEWQTANSRR